MVFQKDNFNIDLVVFLGPLDIRIVDYFYALPNPQNIFGMFILAKFLLKNKA